MLYIHVVRTVEIVKPTINIIAKTRKNEDTKKKVYLSFIFAEPANICVPLIPKFLNPSIPQFLVQKYGISMPKIHDRPHILGARF
jgi:hypothetical protein